MFRQVVMTIGVHERVAEDEQFLRLVNESLKRFWSSDWGDTSPGDAKMNDEDTQRLDRSEGGRVLAVYKGSYTPKWPHSLNELPDRIWIIRDSEATTILFPDEY
jgi:hypothetical protein